MKTIEKLAFTYENKKIGNHRVEKVFRQMKRVFYFHDSPIVTVDAEHRTITLHKAWGSQSETRAVNSYLKHLEPLNYEVVDLRKVTA